MGVASSDMTYLAQELRQPKGPGLRACESSSSLWARLKILNSYIRRAEQDPFGTVLLVPP